MIWFYYSFHLIIISYHKNSSFESHSKDYIMFRCNADFIFLEIFKGHFKRSALVSEDVLKYQRRRRDTKIKMKTFLLLVTLVLVTLSPNFVSCKQRGRKQESKKTSRRETDGKFNSTTRF